MKLLEGCTLVELTDDRIVQEGTYDDGESIAHIRHIGNPNPPTREHQDTINAVAKILMKGYQRRALEEETKVGA